MGREKSGCNQAIAFEKPREPGKVLRESVLLPRATAEGGLQHYAGRQGTSRNRAKKAVMSLRVRVIAGPWSKRLPTVPFIRAGKRSLLHRGKTIVVVCGQVIFRSI